MELLFTCAVQEASAFVPPPRVHRYATSAAAAVVDAAAAVAAAVAVAARVPSFSFSFSLHYKRSQTIQTLRESL